MKNCSVYMTKMICLFIHKEVVRTSMENRPTTDFDEIRSGHWGSLVKYNGKKKFRESATGSYQN